MFFQMGWNHQPVDLWNAMERQNTSDQPRNQRSKKEHMGGNWSTSNQWSKEWLGWFQVYCYFLISFLSTVSSWFRLPTRNGDPQFKRTMRAANRNQPPCLAFWGPWAPPGPCCPAGLAWFPKAPEPTAVCLVYARRPSGRAKGKKAGRFSRSNEGLTMMYGRRWQASLELLCVEGL